MRRQVMLGVAGIVCLSVFVPFALREDAPPAPPSRLDLTQPYLLLTTNRTSTMQEELDEAAAAGYQAVTGSRTGIGNEFAILLKKTAQPPDVYQYRLLATARTSTMQREINEAVADGFRLLPRVMMGSGGQTVVVMEKPPGAVTPTQSDYLLLATALTGTLEAEILQATRQGYQLVGMVRSEHGAGFGPEHVVILERPKGDRPTAASQPGGDERARYRLLATRRTSTMKDELEDAAEDGYRIVTASPTSGTEIEILLERQARGVPPVEYTLVATNQASTLEAELNQAAQRGFRLLPQTLVGKRGVTSGGFGRFLGVRVPGVAPDEILAVLDKDTARTARYHYRVLDTMRTSTMQHEIIDAVRDTHYEVVAMAGSPASEEGTPLPVVSKLRVVLEREVRTEADDVTDEDASAQRELVATLLGPDADVEEKENGEIDLDDGDIDLGEVAVGLRFPVVSIPHGVTIVSAHLQFTAEDDDDEETTILIRAESVAHAAPFRDDDADLTSRTFTEASVLWAPPPWEDNDSGPDQRTPNLARVLQEVVSQPGWSLGNAVVFMLQGVGQRDAESYDDDQPGWGARLYVTYSPSMSSTQP